MHSLLIDNSDDASLCEMKKFTLSISSKQGMGRENFIFLTSASAFIIFQTTSVHQMLQSRTSWEKVKLYKQKILQQKKKKKETTIPQHFLIFLSPPPLK